MRGGGGGVGGRDEGVGGVDGPISTSAQKVARRDASRDPCVFLWRVEGWGGGVKPVRPMGGREETYEDFFRRRRRRTP